MSRKMMMALSVLCLFNNNSIATSGSSSSELTGELFYEGRPCSGVIENDAMAEHCSGQPRVALLHDAGTRYEFESFETVSKALTAEIEADYDMILMVNTAEGSRSGTQGGIDMTPTGAFIPNQHMLVIQKPAGQSKMFTRDRRGVITGLARNVKQLTDIIGTQPLNDVVAANRQHKVRDNAGLPHDWNGLQVIPVTTGVAAAGKMRAFSGIFQVNWGRSDQMFDSNIFLAMSHEMYLGYYYHSRGSSRDTWTNGRRQRVSYAAIHGTPPKKWKKLGRYRDSGGCARVHPMLQKHIRRAAKALPKKNIFEFDWDFNLGEQDITTPYAPNRPVLIMVFDRYDTRGA